MRRTGVPRRAIVLALFGLVVASVAATTATLLPRPDGPAATLRPAHDVLANLPLAFEATEGGFVSRGPGYSFALTPAEAVVGVRDGAFRLRPAGPLANPDARLVPGEALPGTVTRLTGDDPSKWRAGAPTYARVSARQVWPGVDMVWHGDQRRLEHDMVVAPGVDPAVVALDVDGARSLTLDPTGDLVIDLEQTTARLARPVLYQDVAGTRRPVDGEFSLLGPSRIGFRVGGYDPGLPLVIDPTLVTSTLLGGIGNDSGNGIATDTQGNMYVTGATESADFPLQAPLQTGFNGAAGQATSDVFVSKLSPDGARLIWSTYIGGSGRDTGHSVAVAVDGTVYVTGVTESADFPNARAAQTTYGGGTSDGFVARIAANGSGIDWSTFIGGGGTDRARGIAVDSTGNAYVTGSTNSDNFPAVNPQQPGPFRADDVDAFVVKVAPGGSPFVFATRLGGGNEDRGVAVAVDAQTNVYVTGDTLSPTFPTVRPVQATLGGSAGGAAGAFPDAFVAKYNPNGSALVYSTFLGGGDVDQGTAIAVDGQGAAYVAGNTNSSNFPTISPLQAAKNGNEPDAFATKIDAAGGAFVYSTYLGGSGADGANGIAVDRTGSAHVVGITGSPNLWSVKATQPAKAGGDDAFLVRLDSTGRGPLFASFIGGQGADAGMGVAVDGQGNVRVLGLTASSDFPSVKPVQGVRPAAGGDAFVATLELTDPVAAPTTVGSTAAPASTARASSAHDRRVRILGFLTVALLLAAVAQTMYLRRRAPAVAARPAPRPAPRPQAEPGLKMLDKPAGGGTKTTRTPKTRGGPKSATPQKKAAQKKAATKKAAAGKAEQAASTAKAVTEVAAPAEPVAVAPSTDDVDDGGPATEAVPMPAPPPPPPAKAKPQVPVVASLIEEDLWQPEPQDAGGAAGEEPPAPATAPPEPEAAPQWAPFDTGSVEAVDASAPPPQTGPPLPPVPAEELSFWDLFPEDLPPVRPAPFPAEDLLSDHLALPEGPESAAQRLVAPVPEQPPEPVAERPAPQPPPPPPPPDAEIVIAELLDGPPPAGARPAAPSPWAPPAAGEDFVLDDLLAGGRQAPKAQADTPEDGDGGDHLAAAVQGASPEEKARRAADQARRRRSRRSGRRKPPGSG